MNFVYLSGSTAPLHPGLWRTIEKTKYGQATTDEAIGFCRFPIYIVGLGAFAADERLAAHPDQIRPAPLFYPAATAPAPA
ncbi:hypothetical protein, partial [Serratia plymuthica]|uniref:hypothetical protein n=1 Tax=Serratia plymuthica TaxID=82996 RepID=UPI001C7C9EAD